MLLEQAKEMTTGSQGLLSIGLTLTSKWLSLLCLIILLTSTTTIFGPSMTCDGEGMSQSNEALCLTRLHTKKFIDWKRDLFPGVPGDIATLSYLVDKITGLPVEDPQVRDYSQAGGYTKFLFVKNIHPGGFSLLAHNYKGIDPVYNAYLVNSTENTYVKWDWYSYLPLYFMVSIGACTFPRYVWLNMEGGDFLKTLYFLDDRDNSVRSCHIL
jgi:hypothetical protein